MVVARELSFITYHLWIVPRVIYSVTVEASLLYGIKAISFTTLTESQRVEPSAHAPLHLWKSSQSNVGTRTTRSGAA